MMMFRCISQASLLKSLNRDNKVIMANQETLITKKRRGPAPTGQGVLLGVRLHADLLKPLDRWIADQPEPKPSRPEAIRSFLRAGLIR